MNRVQTGPDRSFRDLFYRYWCFGWLFRDAARGGWLEREAALRHNRDRARWLPTYVRRWVVLGSLFYALGWLLERAGLDVVASAVFVPACATVPVLAVAAAGWLVLRGPGANYARNRGDR
ncbi:MAG: hypothetical protein ACXWVT_04200 [Burkholderiaceae bacterium]